MCSRIFHSLVILSCFFILVKAEETCANSTTLLSVVEESYMNHIDLIRQGLPMEIVKFYYDLALKAIVDPGCVCSQFQSEIDDSCVFKSFVENNGYLSQDLHDILEQDSLLPHTDRLFSSLERREDLPVLQQLQLKATVEARAKTLQRIETLTSESWEGVDFPSDETLRFDRDRERVCQEFEQKIDQNGLWLPATVLSAYVVGISHQIYLMSGKTKAVGLILQEQTRISYLAARCKRMDADHIRVPALYVEGYITRAHLGLKKVSTGPRSAMVAGFPSITDVKTIVQGSQHFFPELVRRMSSINSLGKAEYVSWDRFGIRSEDFQDVMGKNASLYQYNEYYSSIRGKSASSSVVCNAGFQNMSRLMDVSDELEYCCSKTCVINLGSAVKRTIINEMCCTCCNGVKCNVDDLAQVVQAQAFGFDHERESSVAHVW